MRWTPESFQRPGLFLWEAFVTGEAKGVDHRHDARIAVETFLNALPSPALVTDSTRHLSLVGAAVLWSGLSTDLERLNEACVVLRASPRTAD